MKKFFFSLFFLTSSFLFAGLYDVNYGINLTIEKIISDDFYLNLWSPTWQLRRHYYGITSSSIGYFYANHWSKNMSVYGSNRYILEDNAELFYQSLEPLETNLLPYATPNASGYIDCQIISEENSTICSLPAKKIVFDVKYLNRDEEIVISYVFTKTRWGIFSNSIKGYTYSVSCPKKKYEEEKEYINEIFNALQIY